MQIPPADFTFWDPAGLSPLTRNGENAKSKLTHFRRTPSWDLSLFPPQICLMRFLSRFPLLTSGNGKKRVIGCVIRCSASRNLGITSLTIPLVRACIFWESIFPLRSGKSSLMPPWTWTWLSWRGREGERERLRLRGKGCAQYSTSTQFLFYSNFPLTKT